MKEKNIFNANKVNNFMGDGRIFNEPCPVKYNGRK